MASALPVIWVFLVVAVLTAGACMLVRKGDKALIRLCIIMTAVCLYGMWAVTFMAQVNPLIYPIRTGWNVIEHH